MAGPGRVRTAAAVALVLALSSACSALAAPRTPAPVQASWPGCEALGAFVTDRGQQPSGQGGVPSGFTPDRVVLCEREVRTTAAGEVGVELERSATDVGPLLIYLARPSERSSNGPCTADGWLAPWLFLLDADGRYVAPEIPVDGCGKPFGWYDDRDHLAWQRPAYTDRVVREVPVGENAQARVTGCPTTYDDVLDASAASTRRRPGGFTEDPFGGRPLRYCTYDVADGSDPRSVFVGGYDLVEDERAQLVAALLSAPEATAACSARPTDLTVVGSKEGGPSLLVETDGCRRVLSTAGETPVVRAGDDLVALLGS